MVAKKKTATSKAQKNKFAPAVSTAIPAGFSTPSGTLTPNHDFEKKPLLQGVIVAINAVKKGGKIKKPTQTMTVKANGSGELSTVWQSATLNGLFADAKAGDEVFIKYEGLAETHKKGQNAAKLFTVGFKPATEEAPKVNKKAKKR